jgi:LacI family transcriptional regulator
MPTAPSPPTLKDVSKFAGVGTTTVSRVMNGGARVKPATFNRVMRAVKQLGYRPNQAARALKGEQTNVIGIIVPSLADPFFSACAAAAQKIARNRGFATIIVSSDADPDVEQAELEILIRHRVDGILVAPCTADNPGLLATLRTIQAPIVTFDRPLTKGGFSEVVTDNRRSARIMTEHLIHHGHKRIACIGAESNLGTIQMRIQGYRDAMRHHGLEAVVERDITSEIAAKSTINRLLASENRPTALFTTKNLTTMCIFASLLNAGWSVPNDVALAGFDDFDMAAFATPAITVIRQPTEQIGAQAAHLLFELMDGGSSATARQRTITLSCELKRRASCGCSNAAQEEEILSASLSANAR